MTNSVHVFKWITVAQDVYEQCLKKEYTDTSCKMDWEFKYNDPQKGTAIIPRPNHGLAHTLRCAMYVPFVAEAYTKFKNLDPISCSDIENIQLSLLFYVVGRENDAGSKEDPYLKFRKKSAEIFGNYVKAHLSSEFSEEKSRFYQAVLTDTCNPQDHRYLLYTITRISHNIDLVRCIPRGDYEGKLLKGVSQNLGDAETSKLAKIVRNCLCNTGDRILGERNYDPLLFARCSTNVYFCLKQINQVLRPAPLQLSPEVPTVGELLTLLCKLIENETIKQKLSEILNNKVCMLLTFHEATPLQLMDQRFLRLAKRVISEENTISTTVVELLIKNSAESNSSNPFLSKGLASK